VKNDPLGYPKTKKLSVSGGEGPLTPRPRTLPWIPLGAPLRTSERSLSSEFAATSIH